MYKRLEDALAVLEAPVQRGEEEDQQVRVKSSVELLKDLYEALQDAREWSVDEEMVARAQVWVTRLEMMHELQGVVVAVRQLTPIKKQSVFIENVHRLEGAISRAEALQVDSAVLQLGRDLIATAQIEFWLQGIMARLTGVEIATEANEHDIIKLGHAITKGQALGAAKALLADASVLHSRLVTELEGTRALLSVPTVRLPIENPPEGYWQEGDRGHVVETEGYPLPPEGGEYVWEASVSFATLQRSVEKIKAILSTSDGSGVNPVLITQLKEKLVKAEKDYKLLEVKENQDKAAAIEVATKLAKKLKKKGGGAKKKKE